MKYLCLIVDEESRLAAMATSEMDARIGAYYLIEARDLNEAIQAASRLPAARLGSIEVRPVWERAT